VTGGTNFQFQADVVDNGEGNQASADRFGLRVWTTTGDYKVVGTYDAAGTNTGTVPFEGGNIQVK
jgi:hypothetical protein